MNDIILFDSFSYESNKGATGVCVVGDSHSRIWARINGDVVDYKHPRTNLLPDFNISVRSIMSCSMYGLANTVSKTNSSFLFKDFIRKTSAKYLLINLGQVDIEYVMYHKKISSKEMTQLSLSSLNEFLKGIEQEVILIPTHAHDQKILQDVLFFNDELKKFADKKYKILPVDHSNIIPKKLLYRKDISDSHFGVQLEEQMHFVSAFRELIK